MLIIICVLIFTRQISRLSRNIMNSSINLESCRLCQNEIGRVFINKNLGQTILNITKIQIDDELYSSMPQNICLLCHSKIIDTQNFIDVVQKEDENMRLFLIEKQNPKSFEKTENIDNNRKNFGDNSEADNCSTVITTKDNAEHTSATHDNNCDQHFQTQNIDNSTEYTDSPDGNCFNDLVSFHPLETQESYSKSNELHQKSRSFLCVTCGKDFSTKNSLTCHEKIHSSVKGYKCDPCNIGFSVRSNLRAHIRKYHEGVRYYCSQCTKAFLTKCSLDRHEKIHTGIKEFKCEHCTSAFYTNKELVKHQRYHQGVKQHKCEECFKTFFERHHLIIHLRSHSGERPYVCYVTGCGKSFVESQKLKRHHKAKHAAK